jgi:hypothetical protein
MYVVLVAAVQLKRSKRSEDIAVAGIAWTKMEGRKMEEKGKKSTLPCFVFASSCLGVVLLLCFLCGYQSLACQIGKSLCVEIEAKARVT